MLLPAVQFILARPWPGNLAQKARANGRTLLISDIMQVLVQVEQVLVLVEQILVHVVLVLLLLVQQAPLIGDIMQPSLKHRTMSAKGQKLMRYNDPAYPTSKLSKSTPDPAQKHQSHNCFYISCSNVVMESNFERRRYKISM